MYELTKIGYELTKVRIDQISVQCVHTVVLRERFPTIGHNM